MEELLERIEIDLAKLGGKPVIRGTRIPVSLMVELVASGMGTEEIIREYPELTEEDIRAALLYAAKLVEKEGSPCNWVEKWPTAPRRPA